MILLLAAQQIQTAQQNTTNKGDSTPAGGTPAVNLTIRDKEDSQRTNV